jgi:uncharacterized protein YjdB
MKIKYFITSVCLFTLIVALNCCKKDSKNVTGIAVSEESVSLSVGASAKVIPYPIPWDAEINSSFTWTTNDENTAMVDDGVITGIAVGETKVICHYGDFTATVQVTVE